ncbi:MAG: DNA topoisomerase VI subunit B [Phycisphaerae bacterium]
MAKKPSKRLGTSDEGPRADKRAAKALAAGNPKSEIRNPKSPPAKPGKPAAKAPPAVQAINPQSAIRHPQSDLPAKRPFATAEQMAKAQRNISVSEFFAKNRHLLGFDNPRKALLTTVKEAVDNSLDACEEAGILPAVEIWIEQLDETHFKVIVQDNGPGIVRKEIPNIFGRLLYGSKFHRLRMSRGQQGIGISAAGMYGLLTTGRPVRITSRHNPRGKALYCELQIDTSRNTPDVIKEDQVDWDVPHGTRVEIELEAKYQRGRQSVDDYLQQTAIANPHVTLVYHAPDSRADRYEASHKSLPPPPKAIRPHPHGIELGVLIKMLTDSRSRTLRHFLSSEFSRVSPRVALEVCQKANLSPDQRPSRLGGEEARAIYNAIQQTRIMAPSTDCVVPIGEEQLIGGLKQVVEAEFYVATSRSPAVYRGNPFIIEAAIAYGKPEQPEDSQTATAGAKSAGAKTAGNSPEDQDREANGNGAEAPAAAPAVAADDEEETSELAKLIRFANRVPLLYQQSACSIYKSVVTLNWRQYGITQARGALPEGPLTVVVHMASVWVPFTSESKEAIASYPEILKEIRLALQECGRKLGTHIRKTVRIHDEMKKRSYIEKYIPAIGEALRDILELKDRQVNKVCADLKHVLEHSRKM